MSCVAGDRRLARAVERREEGALAGERQRRVAMVDRREQIAHPRIVRRGTRWRSSLARRPVENVSSGSSAAIFCSSPMRFSPAEASSVASNSPDSTLATRVGTLPRKSSMRRSGRARRSSASRRSDAEPTRAPCGKCVERSWRPSRQRIANIFALQARADHQSFGEHRLHVLRRMHREVDRCRQKRRLDLLREQPLASRFRERPVADQVAGGLDRHDLDRLRARDHAPQPAHRALRRPAKAPAGFPACRCGSAHSDHSTWILGPGGSGAADLALCLRLTATSPCRRPLAVMCHNLRQDGQRDLFRRDRAEIEAGRRLQPGKALRDRRRPSKAWRGATPPSGGCRRRRRSQPRRQAPPSAPPRRRGPASRRR